MYWHLTLAAEGRLPLFPDRAHTLAAVESVLRSATPVLLFCAADDHLHLLTEGERPWHLAAELRRYALAGRALLAPHFKPVTQRRHLLNLVDYLLRQPAKHDLDTHPALWEGSSFLDLVGARRVGFDPEPLLRALPRLHHRDWLSPVGLRELPVPAEVVGMGLAEVARAVAVAAGLDGLPGPRTAQRMRARRALAHLGDEMGTSVERTAEVLGISSRSVRRLRYEGDERQLMEAARTWLALRAMVRSG